MFGDSVAAGLKMALRDMNLERKEPVIHFSDMFAIGPLWQLHTKEGRKQRTAWMKQHLSLEYDLFFEEEYERWFQHTLMRIESISGKEIVVIWCGENAHEQSGLRYVLYLLRDKANPIVAVNSTKAHRELFGKKNIRYFVLHTGEIGPEKLRMMMEKKACHRALNQKEKKCLIQEWESLANDDAVLRIWEKEKVRNVQEDYFDANIMAAATRWHRQHGKDNWSKAARLIGEVYTHLEQYVGDYYLEYRLRALIQQGVFEAEGALSSVRNYSVRLNV